MSSTKKDPSSCADCSKPTNMKRKKQRREINQEWLKDYFTAKKIDIRYFRFVCRDCYKKLLDQNNSKTLVQKIRELKSVTEMQSSSPIEKEKKNFIESLTNDRCYSLTGININEFNQVLDIILQSNPTWKFQISIGDGLFFYLGRLRLGLSIKKLADLLGICSYEQAKRAIVSIRNLFKGEFTKKFLGLETNTRGDIIINHTTELSKRLYDLNEDALCVVWDGTYIYIEKSSNFVFQKKTYSMHKGRNLVKMMMLVSMTGKILDVFGPYLADYANNDAGIMKDIFKSDKLKFNSFFKKFDKFILDRGFRDCIEFLEDLGIETKMPSFLKERKQHTTAEANKSRLVTKTRWVVEAVNGVIKRWTYFRNVIPNKSIRFVDDDFRAVCAIINAFRPPRSISKDNDTEIADLMKSLSNKNNDLKKVADEFSNRISKKKLIDPLTLKFPFLTYSYLEELTIGTFQLKNVESYTFQHTNEDGDYQCEYFLVDEKYLRVKLESRHLSRTVYNVWINFTLEKDEDPIKGWYCNCKNGARVVGTCAHVASVLWFIGFARNNPECLKPKESDMFFQYCFDAGSIEEEPELITDDEFEGDLF